MIQVDHISKDFAAPKKYPGLRGAIKGLFSNEKTVKMMTGILTPTRGECRVAGIDPSRHRKENAQNIRPQLF